MSWVAERSVQPGGRNLSKIASSCSSSFADLIEGRRRPFDLISNSTMGVTYGWIDNSRCRKHLALWAVDGQTGSYSSPNSTFSPERDYSRSTLEASVWLV